MSEEIQKNTNVLKVVQLGLQQKIYEAMKKPDFSVEALAREFNSDGIEISGQSIRKFVKKNRQAQQELIAKDVRASNEIMKTAMDYNKALKDILKEVKEVKNEAKDEKDFTTYNQLIGRLLQGIELFAKLTGDIKPKGNIDIKIIYNQINEDIEKDMKDVRKDIFDKIDTVDVDFEIVEEDKIITEKLNKGEL